MISDRLLPTVENQKISKYHLKIKKNVLFKSVQKIHLYVVNIPVTYLVSLMSIHITIRF